MEHFTWDLHAHKALTCHGYGLKNSYVMSTSPKMVEIEEFIIKGIA